MMQGFPSRGHVADSRALSTSDAGGLKLQQHFRHGSFGEQMMMPTENVKRIGTIDESEAAQWCALGTLLVPDAGFPRRRTTSRDERSGFRATHEDDAPAMGSRDGRVR